MRVLGFRLLLSLTKPVRVCVRPRVFVRHHAAFPLVTRWLVCHSEMGKGINLDKEVKKNGEKKRKTRAGFAREGGKSGAIKRGSYVVAEGRLK